MTSPWACDDSTAQFDALPVAQAEALLLGCCTAPSWAAAVAVGRPYGSRRALIEAATAAVLALSDADLDAALARHAPIGAPTDDRSAHEQAGAAELAPAGRRELVEGNRRYVELFGRSYLVRAAGRSGEELLALLRWRLDNDVETEAEVVRTELAEITALRLASLRL